MQRRIQIYKCPICDTVVEVLEQCGLELVCCGPEMIPLKERVCAPSDPHGIAIERCRDGVRIHVGQRRHQMVHDHQIVWLEVCTEGQCYRQFLKPGEAPEAFFGIAARDIVARAYCNAHGLWRTDDSPKRTKRKSVKAIATAFAVA